MDQVTTSSATATATAATAATAPEAKQPSIVETEATATSAAKTPEATASAPEATVETAGTPKRTQESAVETEATGTALLTFDSYAQVTTGMSTLAPEWIPTPKELKANSMLASLFEEGKRTRKQEQAGKQGERERAADPFFAKHCRDEYMLQFAWTQTKLPLDDPDRSVMLKVQEQLGYRFTNERLLLQAFTRKSFYLTQLDHDGEIDPSMNGADYEVLELVGDSVMSSAVFKIFLRQHARFLGRGDKGELYFCDYDEGPLAERKQRFTSKEHLLSRCLELGFDQYIRWGRDDDKSKPDAKEDIMEAVVGAVAIDCDWDMEVIEDVVERLLAVHLAFDPWHEEQDEFDILNSWWQKKFGGKSPNYRTWKTDEKERDGSVLYAAELTFNLKQLDAERDWEAWIEQKRAEDEYSLPRLKLTQLQDRGSGNGSTADNGSKAVEGDRDRNGLAVKFASKRRTRSEARSMCAKDGLSFIKKAGLFMNLRDSGITPCLAESTNQLNILHQKGYIGKPEYSFDDLDDRWDCICRVDSFWDGTDADTKKAAKKKAAFAVLIQIFRSAGIDDPEWDKVFEEEEE